MHNLKTTLLNTDYFIDNKYLTKYIKLVTTTNIFKNDVYTEKHHILPRAYFNIIGAAVDNSKRNLVQLSFVDHCLAHWYLSMCTIEPLKYANQTAFLIMVGNVRHNQHYKDLSEADAIYLAEKQEKIRISLRFVWTEEEDLFLTNNYLQMSDHELAKALTRKIGSIRSRRIALGLYRVKERPFTDEELNLITALYPMKTIKEIAELLDRCPNSISAKKCRLKLKKYSNDYIWTETQISLLKQYATTKSLTELAELLGRSKSAIKNYCHKHHIKCKRTDLWLDTEKQFIKDNYYTMTAKQMGLILNKSTGSVNHVIYRLLVSGELKSKNKS